MNKAFLPHLIEAFVIVAIYEIFIWYPLEDSGQIKQDHFSIEISIFCIEITFTQHSTKYLTRIWINFKRSSTCDQPRLIMFIDTPLEIRHSVRPSNFASEKLTKKMSPSNYFQLQMIRIIISVRRSSEGSADILFDRISSSEPLKSTGTLNRKTIMRRHILPSTVIQDLLFILTHSAVSSTRLIKTWEFFCILLQILNSTRRIHSRRHRYNTDCNKSLKNT